MFGVRLDEELERQLAAAARRRGISRSELARRAIREYLARQRDGEEARRQSLRASRQDTEHEPLQADERGWKA